MDCEKFVPVSAASQELDGWRNQINYDPNTGKFKVSNNFWSSFVDINKKLQLVVKKGENSKDKIGSKNGISKYDNF